LNLRRLFLALILSLFASIAIAGDWTADDSFLWTDDDSFAWDNNATASSTTPGGFPTFPTFPTYPSF